MSTASNSESQEFIHFPLDQTITAISGHYIVVKEVCLPFRGRKLLYLVGYAIVDTSCCGVGGCTYAQVAGFVLNWKTKNNPAGHLVSKVEPIRDKSIQREVQRLIKKNEHVQQVNFI
ncbi:MAG: hypothetical protein PVI06_12850 [Desulfobacterales bacterium]|jgi:hypothetical protein